MAYGDYYNPSNKVVVPGAIVYADDLNKINSSTDAGFAQVASDLDSIVGSGSVAESKAWATAAAGTRPDVLINDYSSKAYAQEAKGWASGAGLITEASTGLTLAGSASAKTKATEAAASASSAAGSASTATTQAGIATTQAGLADTARGLAVAAKDAATTQAGIATTKATLAADYAGKAEDVQVEPGTYSAYHYSKKAQASAASVGVPITAIGALTPAADKIPYYTGATTASLATFTATGRSIVGAVDVSAAKTALGLGNVANVDSTNGSNITTGIVADARIAATISRDSTVGTAVQTALNLKANLASPTFTGTPLLTTSPGVDDNTLKLASTAFVLGQASTADPSMNGTAGPGTGFRYSKHDHVHPSDTSRALLAGSAAQAFSVAAGAGTQAIQAAQLAESSGSSLVGYMPAGAGAVARTVQSKERERVSVKDFGAIGDGVSDDTIYIQAALNNGGTIYFDGVSVISSSLIVKSNTKIVGVNGGGVKLANAANTNCFSNLNYGEAVDTNIVFENLYIDGNVANQTNNGTYNKHGIRFSGVSKVLITGCLIKNCGTDCINLISCDYPVIRNNEIFGAYNHAVTFQECDGFLGESNTIHDCGSKTDAFGFTSSGHAMIGYLRSDNVRMLGNFVYNMGDSCLRNERAGEGWVISNNTIIDSGKDSIKIMGIAGSGNPRPKANVISGNVVINAGCTGIYAIGNCVVTGNYVMGTGKNVAGTAYGKWFASASCIQVADYADDVFINGNYCVDGLYAGVYLDDTTNTTVSNNVCRLSGIAGIAVFDSNKCTITNNICTDNGTTSVGSGFGIRVNLFGAASQTGHIVQNNKCCNIGTVNQGYGISITGVDTSYCSVQFNKLTGNAITPYTGSTFSGSGNVINQNTGYVTENSGLAVVIAGTYGGTYAHGLSKTPNLKDVTVTPLSNIGSANNFYLGTPDSTSLVLNITVPQAENLTFAWSVHP